MSAAEALRAAHAAGITVRLDGEGLLLEAQAEPPQAVLDVLAQHKREILGLLHPGQCGWTAGQWQAYFDDRCGIAAKNGGSPRAEAQALALAFCVTEWLNQHPAPSVPRQCAWCDKPETPGAVVVPFGTEPSTHTWLHAHCWHAWHRARQADAIAALAVMGIQARGHGRRPGLPTLKEAT